MTCCCPNEHRCGCDDPLEEPEHAEGCRCPECDPDWNDPRNEEEDITSWAIEDMGTTARALWRVPNPSRAKS